LEPIDAWCKSADCQPAINASMGSGVRGGSVSWSLHLTTHGTFASLGWEQQSVSDIIHVLERKPDNEIGQGDAWLYLQLRKPVASEGK
jgi:hypothetical protein